MPNFSSISTEAVKHITPFACHRTSPAILQHRRAATLQHRTHARSGRGGILKFGNPLQLQNRSYCNPSTAGKKHLTSKEKTALLPTFRFGLSVSFFRAFGCSLKDNPLFCSPNFFFGETTEIRSCATYQVTTTPPNCCLSTLSTHNFIMFKGAASPRDTYVPRL